MTQDLQQLLEKIQRDGVDKAQVEADQLLSDARAQAKAILDTAQAAAGKTRAEAQQEATAFERRAEETIRQAARDKLLSVEKAVTALFTRLLLKEVKAALNDHALVAGLAAEAVRAYLDGKEPVELAASAQLADALRAKLAEQATAGLNIVTDETAGTGFRVRLANGRIEHDFSGPALAEALAKGLRPRLAALMKS